MQTRTTDILDLRREAPVQIPSALVPTPPNGTDFQDLFLIRGASGGIVLFSNEVLVSAQGAAALTFPLSIDWQLLRGLGEFTKYIRSEAHAVKPLDVAIDSIPACVWEPAPLATGTTNVANTAGLAREGMLFQVVGSLPSWWLLRGRLNSAAGTSLSLTFTAARCGFQSCSGPLLVTVGNMIG